MMLQVLLSLGAAILGACAGSFVAWRLARRSAHVDRLQRHLEEACHGLQRYRAAYGQFYAEYLSPAATEAKGSWPPPASNKRDMGYLHLERLVDETRGSLRVHGGILRAMLRPRDGRRADELISRVLHQSSPQFQQDSIVVDDICNRAMDELIQLMPTR